MFIGCAFYTKTRVKTNLPKNGCKNLHSYMWMWEFLAQTPKRRVYACLSRLFVGRGHLNLLLPHSHYPHVVSALETVCSITFDSIFQPGNVLAPYRNCVSLQRSLALNHFWGTLDWIEFKSCCRRAVVDNPKWQSVMLAELHPHFSLAWNAKICWIVCYIQVERNLCEKTIKTVKHTYFVVLIHYKTKFLLLQGTNLF